MRAIGGLLSRGGRGAGRAPHTPTTPHVPAPHPPATHVANHAPNNPGAGTTIIHNTHAPTGSIPHTPTGAAAPKGIVSRITGAAGGVARDTVMYGAMTFGLGYVLDNYVYHTPTPLGDPDKDPPNRGPLEIASGAAEAFMHGAGDTVGFLASIPGDIVEGIAGAAGTAQTVTYLITAGVLIGGAVYLYRE